MKTDYKIKKNYKKPNIYQIPNKAGVTNENHPLFKTQGAITTEKEVFIQLNRQETFFLGYVHDQIDKIVFVDVYLYDSNNQGCGYVYSIKNQQTDRLLDVYKNSFFHYHEVLDPEIVELLMGENWTNWTIQDLCMDENTGYFINLTDIIKSVDLHLHIDGLENKTSRQQAEILFEKILNKKRNQGPFSVPTCQYYKRALANEIQTLSNQLLMPEKLVELYINNKYQGMDESEDDYVKKLAKELRVADDKTNMVYLKQVIDKIKRDYF